MNKAILISIQPKWCGLILKGEKVIEVRKTRPKLKPPFKCYIYQTKGKERLIDICDTMTKMCRLQACGFCKYKLLKPHCVCEAIADTMLKNGVIVPPVRVGDVVYIVCNVDNKTVIEEASVEEVSTKRIWTDEVDYDLEEIGKTVFLSREEAEKALAERNGKE